MAHFVNERKVLNMWFDSWADVLRTIAVGSAAYATLVLVLRISGKRTLSQLNAFDFVVTVALGSIFATILLSTDVSWAEGVSALVLVAALQFFVAWMSAKWPRLRGMFTSRPVFLLVDGKMQHGALRTNRLTESEVAQAVRNSGSGDLSLIAAVILETNGKLSVVPSAKLGSGSALDSVPGTIRP